MMVMEIDDTKVGGIVGNFIYHGLKLIKTIRGGHVCNWLY